MGTRDHSMEEGAEETQVVRPRAGTCCVLLVVASVLVGGCRAMPQAGPQVFGNDGAKDKPAPVAVIAGRPLSTGELADWWFERYPEEYGRTLGTLIDERLAIRDARAQGVRVPRAALTKAVHAEVEARRKQLHSLYGDAADLAAEVQRAYGVDVPTWRTKVLVPRLHARLLMERVVRWDTRRRERVHARVIVLADAAHARGIVQRLRKGADFSLLAAKESLDPSGKRGGDLPWIGRGDLSFPGVEKRLFEAPAGSIVGPLEVRVAGKAQFQVYKIIRRPAPWTGSLETHWQRLEEDLVARRVDQGEFERWRTRARRDGGVRLYRPDGRVWQAPAQR